MKYPPLLYAKALVEIASRRLENGENETVARNFLELVKKNGDTRHLPKILEYAEQLLLKKSGAELVEIETARKFPEESINVIKQIFDPRDAIRESMDPKLIAGIKITVNNERQFDASLARKLRNLFPTS